MIKLNKLQYPETKDINVSKEYALDILKNNDKYENLEEKFLRKFGYLNLKTFSFNPDGFLSLLCSLGQKGKIAISKGETISLVKAGEIYESLGFKVNWIPLKKNGKVDINILKNLDVDFLFLSSYVMDTFVKTDIKTIKSLIDTKIISNGTFAASKHSDVLYFDPYKLFGFATSGVILFNDEFETQSIGFKDNLSVILISEILDLEFFSSSLKNEFKKELIESFGDDIYFFVDSDDTFDEALHFGLKGIKARELIRTLALDEILITNGEGCSLGLSKPSSIIQTMGYDEDTSRNSISLSFNESIELEKIKEVVKIMNKRYKQIRILNGK